MPSLQSALQSPDSTTMPATSQPASNNAAVLNERVVSIQSDIGEIKSSLACVSSNLERLERLYLVEHEKLSGRLDVTSRRLDEQITRSNDNTKRIEEITNQVIKLEKSIQPLIFSNKILIWLGGILGASVVALIWMIITGQVALVFP